MNQQTQHFQLIAGTFEPAQARLKFLRALDADLKSLFEAAQAFGQNSKSQETSRSPGSSE